jgi:hypothetical protein
VSRPHSHRNSISRRQEELVLRLPKEAPSWASIDKIRFDPPVGIRGNLKGSLRRVTKR